MVKFLISVLTLFVFEGLLAQNKTTTLVWDASYSMYDKNFEKEIAFLDALMASEGMNSTNVLVFSNVLRDGKVYTEENMAMIKQDLASVVYDGATVIPEIKNAASIDLLLYISDGKETIQLPEGFEGTAYIISSILDIPKDQYAKAELPYINLNFIDIKGASEIVQGITSIDSHTAYLEKKLEEQRASKMFTISGTLVDQYGPLEKVQIRSFGSEQETVSDSKGYYTIKTFEDDLVTFVSDRNISRTLRIINSNEREINVVLDENINDLGEVFIKGKNTSEEKETFLGKDLDEDRKLGYTVSQLNASDLNPNELTVGQMIGNKVAGVQFQDNQSKSLGGAIIRGYSSISGNNFAQVFVDGVPLSGTGPGGRIDDFSFIDPNTVDNIRVLKGLAATSVYGAQGVNGVILITTKKKAFKSDKIRDNIYEDKLSVSASTDSYEALENILQTGNNAEASYSLYLKERLKSENERSLSFYFDAFDYFQKNGAAYLGLRVASNISELYSKEPEVLLALAYKYDQKYQKKQALVLYKMLLENDQKSIQNQRNYAQSLCDNGFFREGFARYLKLLNSTMTPLPDELKTIIIREMKHAYHIQSEKEDLSKIGMPPFLRDKTEADGRILFEWNREGANFDLQFINPDKLFYTWKHTTQSSYELLAEERQLGYGMKEFMLEDAEKGQWFFNVLQPEETNAKTNSFLKITVIKNYGQANEAHTVKLIDLSKIEGQQTVASLFIE